MIAKSKGSRNFKAVEKIAIIFSVVQRRIVNAIASNHNKVRPGVRNFGTCDNFRDEIFMSSSIGATKPVRVSKLQNLKIIFVWHVNCIVADVDIWLVILSTRKHSAREAQAQTTQNTNFCKHFFLHSTLLFHIYFTINTQNRSCIFFKFLSSKYFGFI